MSHQYSDARIVRLAPSNDSGPVEVATFAEAFGAHSNLKGKGRARRAKRKASRQANRQTKRMTRIQNRQERKVARKTNRQANKQQRVEARATKKATRQDARLTRKAQRKESRGGGEEDEVVPPEDQMQSETPMESSGAEEQVSQESAESPDQSSQSASPDEEGEVETVEETEEWSPEDGEDEDAQFAGEESNSAFNNEVSDHRPQIHPKVQDLANKIVWREELVSRLEGRMGKGEDDARLQMEIDASNGRIEQMESMLGQYSEARGGRGGFKAAVKSVAAAKSNAKQNLTAAKSRRSEKKAGRVEKRMARKAGRGALPTPADSLQPTEPDMGSEEATEFAGGTGSGISQDQANPQAIANSQTVELTSNASGPLASFDWKTALVAAGVVAGVIIVLKATKVI